MDTRYQLNPHTLLLFSIISVLIFTLSFISILIILQPISAQTNLNSPSSLSANQTEDILIPLPSWNDITAKHNIIEFVQNVTNPENN